MTKLAVGIDVGGTNTVIGLIDREGKVYFQTSLSTQKQEKVEDYVKDVCDAISEAQKSVADCELVGIGIGAPNGNYYKGTIENAANLRWEGIIHFTDLFKKYFDLPVFLTNDANAAAIGEMVYGGAKNMKDFAVITLGTGLGSGIVVNGKLQYGHDGFAGELGHITVVRNGRECGCGKKGCLETYVSATGLVRTTFEQMALSNAESDLRNIPFSKLTSKQIAEAASNGDSIAIEALTKTGITLGEAMADFINIASPEAIFLFGGLARAGKILFDPAEKAKEENVLPIFKGKTKLLPSQLGDDAAILGSSALVWTELN